MHVVHRHTYRKNTNVHKSEKIFKKNKCLFHYACANRLISSGTNKCWVTSRTEERDCVYCEDLLLLGRTEVLLVDSKTSNEALFFHLKINVFGSS